MDRHERFCRRVTAICDLLRRTPPGRTPSDVAFLPCDRLFLRRERFLTKLDLHADEHLDEMTSAQDKLLDAVGMRVRVQLWIGLLDAIPSNL
jgi:hypothetical protein